jgi:hypothetical protein
VTLVEPSEKWECAFLEMAAEWSASGETRYAAALSDFPGYLRKVEDGRRDIQSADRVPGTEYWLEDGGKIVACVRLRFRLTAELEQEGGHIGYDVRPPCDVVDTERICCDWRYQFSMGTGSAGFESRVTKTILALPRSSKGMVAFYLEPEFHARVVRLCVNTGSNSAEAAQHTTGTSSPRFSMREGGASTTSRILPGVSSFTKPWGCS